MNKTFTILCYSTFEEHEMADLADRYIPVVDPRFIKCVVNTKTSNRLFIAIPKYGTRYPQSSW